MKNYIYIFILISNAAFADIIDYAQVIDYNKPVMREQYETSNQSYQRQRHSEPQEKPIAGAIIGGVVGGLLGNQVGGGSGRAVATATGAIAGAIVGDRVQSNNSNNQQYNEPIRNCYQMSEQVQNGYLVTYRYAGKTDTIRTRQRPGTQIRVIISPN